MAYIQRINGTIYSDGWFGYQLERALNTHQGEEVHIVMTSPGGEVSEAIRLSDMIKAHGNVTVEFSGLAASAATWLGFAANKVIMHQDTLWLCHKSSTIVAEWTTMNEDELKNYIAKLQNEAKSLEVIDAIIAAKYLDRCKKKGKNLEDVVNLMKEERYLAPEDCLEWGFVDEIIEQPSGIEDIANIINCFNLPQAPEQQHKVTESQWKIGDVINVVLDKIKDMFEPKHQDIVNQNEYKMNKNFNFVNALLGIEGFDMNEESKILSVTEDQMNSMESRFNALSGLEKEMNDITAQLDAISPAIKDITGVANKINALKAIVDHVPAPADPAVPATKQTVTIEDGNDPVNEIARKYMNK